MNTKITKKLLIGASMLATATAAFEAPASDIMPLNVKSIAVFGDSPYGTSNADTAQFDATPAFIDSINADTDVSLVLHVGDIHSGKQFCTKDYDLSVFKLWTSSPGFEDPLVYTPGDNEWADCHKPKEGAGDPIANLQLIRSIFFANPGHTLGDSKLVLSQAQVPTLPANASDRNYVENVMWMQSRVLFVTVNIPGGSNNDSDPWYGATTMSQAQIDEKKERTDADLRWLDYAYLAAKVLGAKAIVIQEQADMWDLDGTPLQPVDPFTLEKIPNHIAEYKPFIDKIAVKTKAFGKPVLLLNGDSHIFRSDNPLLVPVNLVVPDPNCFIESGATCPDYAYTNQKDNLPINNYNVPNFHRLVVHGSAAPMEWLKLTINPGVNAPGSANAFGPFSWKRVQP
jgi:hypothetical protein